MEVHGVRHPREGLSIAHDLRDHEAVGKLELLREGLPEKYRKVEAVTDELAVLHFYPGAATELKVKG